MDVANLKKVMLEVISQYSSQGPGFFQSGPGLSVAMEQKIGLRI